MLRKTPKYERIAFVASPAPEAKKALARLVKLYGNVAPSKADVVVALGGDGLMLRTLRQAMKGRRPIYGMHRGTVGFLMNEFHEKGLRERLQAAQGPIIPINADLMAVTPISPFRPRRWRGALLPDSARITIRVIDPERRPVAAVADHAEVRSVRDVDIRMDHSVSMQMLFDPGHSLDERILSEQFGH